MVAQRDTGRAVLLEIIPVIRRVREQALGFLPRLQGLLPLQQHHGVVEASGMVVRSAVQHRLQHRLGLVEVTARLADPREQTQGADIEMVLAQMLEDHLLGHLKVAVGHQTVSRHHRHRQLLEDRQLLCRRGGLSGIALHPVKLLQHVPAGRQGGVQVHRPPQCADGRRRILQQDLAVAALLVQPTEQRVLRLQTRQHRQGFRHALAYPQVLGLLQQRVTLAHRAAPARNGSSQSGSGWSAS